MNLRYTFFQTSVLAAMLMFSLGAVRASAEIVAFRDSTGTTELVDTENPGAHAMPAGPWEMYAKVGGIQFNVSYEDVNLNNGIGFDDATYGADRRARVAEVFAYINSVLNHTGVCDVVFSASDNLSAGNPLASGGSYYWLDPGFTNGFAFDHITTGTDPYASLPDVHVVVHFGWSWYQGTGTPSFGEIDLKSVLLHEVTHGLGLLSLTEANGTSSIGAGVYAKWDDLLETGNGKNLFGGNPPAFLGLASDLTGGDGGVRFAGANAMSIFGSKPPIYAPSSWEDGSSIAHWDAGTAGGPVMEPAISNGEAIREFAPFEIGALNDIGYTVASTAEGEGEGEGEFGFVETPTGGWFEEGDRIDLSVSVQYAAGTVAYQWKKDGVPILAATSSTYTMDPAMPDDTGDYTCQATDGSKTMVETAPVSVLVYAYGTLPAAGAIGLAVAAVSCMGMGMAKVRRRKR